MKKKVEKKNRGLDDIVQKNINNLDYLEIAKNIRRMFYLSREERNLIVKKAISKLSEKTIKKIDEEITILEYDKSFYEVAKLRYCDGPPKGENFFVAGFVNYLLKDCLFK